MVSGSLWGAGADLAARAGVDVGETWQEWVSEMSCPRSCNKRPYLGIDCRARRATRTTSSPLQRRPSILVSEGVHGFLFVIVLNADAGDPQRTVDPLQTQDKVASPPLAHVAADATAGAAMTQEHAASQCVLRVAWVAGVTCNSSVSIPGQHRHCSPDGASRRSRSTDEGNGRCTCMLVGERF